jgi:ATP-dependent DNA ligase
MNLPPTSWMVPRFAIRPANSSADLTLGLGHFPCRRAMRRAGPSTDYLRQILSARAQRQPRAATSLYSRLNPKAVYRLQETKGDAVSSWPQAPNANLWKAHRSKKLRPDLRIRVWLDEPYMGRMPKAPFQPCIPTRGTKVLHHADWIHEIKQDGFRLIVQRDMDRVRLFTRNGYDWTSRHPLIVEAAHRIRTKQFVIDGEAVLLGVDGISDFDGLYSGTHTDEVQLYAFDILALDGDDLRKLPLHLRKD